MSEAVTIRRLHGAELEAALCEAQIEAGVKAFFKLYAD